MKIKQQQNSYITPFSGAFILGLLTKPVICQPLIQQAINKLVKTFSDLHPNVIKRMTEFAPAIMILNPVDTPFSFLVEFMKNSLNILIVDDKKYSGNDVTKISAPFTFFLNMLEGELDGDALFFSRKLEIEGDTTIVIALRNILESENVNINDDINEQFSIFAHTIKFIKNTTNYIISSIDNDLSKIKHAIINEPQSDINLQKSKQQIMQSEIASLQKEQNLLNNKLQSMRLKINKKGVNNE